MVTDALRNLVCSRLSVCCDCLILGDVYEDAYSVGAPG